MNDVRTFPEKIDGSSENVVHISWSVFWGITRGIFEDNEYILPKWSYFGFASLQIISEKCHNT